jgi:serine/threonine-protein kinase
MDMADRLAAALTGRYRVDREVGRGGMAVVYRAEDLRHHRAVAIKVLLPELADVGPERFLREIDIAAHLTHPNILALHDSGEADGLLYYVMPFVEGDTLRGRLRREGRLPPAEAVRIAHEVADALGYAHAQGVVHRDIKPENVLFQAGHAVVSDFGIARAVGATTAITESGMAVGTVVYMSPEQAWASKEVDGRSDVYSLGCVLYEMLAGEPPFAGAMHSGGRAREGEGPLPGLRAAGPGVSPVLEAVLAKALERVPDQRYASGSEFAEALGTLLASGADARSIPAPRRRRRALLGLASVVVVASVFWVVRWTGPTPIRSIAVLPLQNLLGDSAQDYFVQGMHDALIAELAGIGSLRVISRTSTMRYRDTDKPVPVIAGELNVDALIEASVLRSGDSVSVRVNLVRARPSEEGLWSHSYDQDLRHILDIYRDVARSVASQVRVRLSPEEERRLAGERTVVPAAYDAYLRGMFLLHGATDAAGFQRGLAELQQAIALDSTEPLPWAGLALAYDQIGHLSEELPDAFARAKAAAARAQELGGELGETEAALAETALYFDWDTAAAGKYFLRAIELNGSIPDAHSNYGWLLILSGRTDEALAQMRRGEDVDPLTPLWPAFTAMAMLWSRRPELAGPALARALALKSDFPIALYAHSEALAAAGLHDSAVAVSRRAAGLLPAWRFYYGAMLARAGQRIEALAVAADLERAPTVLDRWGLAQIYAELGEADRAIHWLEEASAARWNWMLWMDFNPGFARIRGDPRFRALKQRVGAPTCGNCPRDH